MTRNRFPTALLALATASLATAAATAAGRVPTSGLLAGAQPAAVNSWIVRLEGSDEKRYVMRVAPLDQPTRTLVGTADTQGCGLATIDGTLSASNYQFRVVHTDQVSFAACCAYTVSGTWDRGARQGVGIYVNDALTYDGNVCGGHGELMLWPARR